MISVNSLGKYDPLPNEIQPEWVKIFHYKTYICSEWVLFDLFELFDSVAPNDVL